MNLNEPSMLIGVSIISEFHERFVENVDDDRDHITNLSLVIKGISGYLKTTDMPEKERRKVALELKEYGKKLWIDTCVEQRQDDDPEAEIREESEILYDYIFKNHEYPE